MVRTLLALALSIFVLVPARAQTVGVSLVLAIDVSSSVDEAEYLLQMRGLAEAFRHPDVLSAIGASTGGVAVALVQWSDSNAQTVSIGWTHVFDPASAASFAEQVQATPRAFTGGQTAVGNAIQFSLALLDQSAYQPLRQVIDISSDGRANSGATPMSHRDRAIARGVTINGLAIMNEEPFVDRFFARNVIGGGGSFLMTAENYEDFAAAIVKKLVREIGAPLATPNPSGAKILALRWPGAALDRSHPAP